MKRMASRSQKENPFTLVRIDRTVRSKEMKVLITSKLTEQQLKKIESLSGILNIVICKSESEVSRSIADAEVVAGWVDGKTLRKAKRLKWLHTFSTGVDSLICQRLLRRDTLVTCSKGAHAIPVAEHAVMFMLMLAKHMPFYTRCQQNKKWKWLHTSELHGRTVGIVGFGYIGREIARLSRGFGMKVIATRRTGSVDLGADALIPIKNLKKLLSSSDFVVAAVPLTKETKGMFREGEFKAMKRGGYFINIARGGLVVEKALVNALKKGWISGAALDVTEVEPPPPDSELYDLDNLILTPHVSGGSREAFERSLEIFRENLRRYLSGEPLLNIVDKSICY